MGINPDLEDGQAWHIDAYEWKSGTVNVMGTTPTTNLNTITGFTTIFNTVKRAHRISITSSGTLYVALNNTSNDIITVTATTPYTDNYAIVYAIFVASNGSGVTATVTLR